MRISWDDQNRFYTDGISNGVLFPKNSPGVAWNGLTSVKEKGDDAVTSFYIDGQRYKNRVVPSTFAGTIVAFTYPDEFEPYNGNFRGLTAQTRPAFGFSYQTNQELHIVYNVLISPSNDQYKSIGASVDPVAFSWDFTTLPIAVPGGRPTAHLIIDLNDVHSEALSALEDKLYGNDVDDAFQPDIASIFMIFDTYATVSIIDNGDGTWTATGPDDLITMLDDDTFQIVTPGATFISPTAYTIKSF